MKGIKEVVRASFEDAAKHEAAVDDLENETWFSAGHWVVAETGGRVVSALGLRPGVIWMSGVAVPTSTVGTVCTLPELRARGIGAQVVRFAHELLRRDRVVLSRLHTWAQRFAFYGRLGYVKTINDSSWSAFAVDRISSRTQVKAEAEAAKSVIRMAKARDAARLLEIYETMFSKGTGSLSRNEHFMRRRIGGKPKLWLWDSPKFAVAERGKEGIVGYVAHVLGGEQPRVVELAALPRHAGVARGLLLHVAREAQRLKLAKVDVSLDGHQPLGWLVHEFPLETTPGSTVLFLKVHDEKRFVRLMKPVIRRRAVRFEVKLRMSLAGMEDITVGSGQKVRVVTDVPHLAALVYNGAWLAGLMGEGALLIRPQTLAAYRALQQVFPDTHAARGMMDGY